MGSRFTVGVQRWVNKSEREVEALVKGVTTKLFFAVVKDTPVLSGRLAGNWNISSDAPDAGVTKVLDPSRQTTLRKIENHVAKADLKRGGQTFLTNALPYAWRIEYRGHSKIKAPEGMVRKNFIRISQQLKVGR